MIQIIQLVHSPQVGKFFAWVVVDGIMLKIPISIPRVFYLNSRSPTEEFSGKRVNKTLPHGRHSYNLYEVLVVLLLHSPFLKSLYWWCYFHSPFFKSFSDDSFIIFSQLKVLILI